MGPIRWIFGFLTALVIAAFAVSNRAPTLITWSPFHAPLELPLYLVGLGLMAMGFFFGGLTVWLNTAPVRREKRKQKKQIKILEKQLEAVNENETQGDAPSDFFPALPAKRK